MIPESCQLIDIGAEHVGHCVGVTRDLRLVARCLRELLANLAQRRLDQLAGKRPRRIRRPGQGLPHEGRDDALTGGPRVVCFGRIAIERRGVAERRADRSLLALGTNEGVDERAQPYQWRFRPVRQDVRSSLVRRHSSLWRRNRIDALFGKY
jgi:hypothetical protein